MKKIINYLSFILIMIFNGCSGTEPSFEDIIGTWKANDSAVFILKKDGTFFTENLPGNMMFPMVSEYENKKFNETGSWAVKEWQGQWIVDLAFVRSENLPKGYATRLLISGEGVLENNPPWNLFLWVGEEGGDRYTFQKENTSNQ